MKKIIGKTTYTFHEISKYIVVYIWIIGYCITHWVNPSVLSRLNPDIPYGGSHSVPKSVVNTILTSRNKLAKKYLAKTLYFKKGGKTGLVLAEIEKSFDNRPVVIKPDVGLQSYGVSVIMAPKTRNGMISKYKADFLIQEYIPYKYELSVFYIKYPSWKNGKVWGIAMLNFRQIEGDGKRNIYQHLRDVKTTLAIRTYLAHEYETLEYVPKRGEMIPLVNTANHSYNERYSNRSDLITPAVSKRFNDIMDGKRIYFCRFDIRARSLKEFSEKATGFKIMELNVGPETVALHAFDKRYSITKQAKIYIEEYKHAFRIAYENRHLPRINLKTFMKNMLKNHHRLHKLKRSTRKKEKRLNGERRKNMHI